MYTYNVQRKCECTWPLYWHGTMSEYCFPLQIQCRKHGYTPEMSRGCREGQCSLPKKHWKNGTKAFQSLHHIPIRSWIICQFVYPMDRSSMYWLAMLALHHNWGYWKGIDYVSTSLQCGVLQTCFHAGNLEPFKATHRETADGWKEQPQVTLWEAACHQLLWNSFTKESCICKAIIHDTALVDVTARKTVLTAAHTVTKEMDMKQAMWQET